METLRDLKEIFSKATERFNQYDGKDFILPQIFKEQVQEINSSKVTYNQYSAVIETRGNQNGVLNIFLPNQWFYIASYFTDLYNELQKYKKEALKVVSKERLKELNGGSLSSEENSLLASLDIDDNSKKYLAKFITDYNWWSGAKTIDRGDFYVSPILTCAKLVNASQSFVADLCAFLADKQSLVKAIISGEEAPTKLIVNEKNLTSFILKTIKYFNEKDGLDSIVPYASDSSPIKVYKENAFRLTGMFLNSNIEDVKTRNIGHQRWFEDVFKLGEREVYLSTQWNGQGGYQLTLPDFIELIRTCYGKNYSYKKGPNGEHQLYLTGEILGKLNEKRTLQQIFYGAPGTGKSFEINRLTKDKEVIRTTFHPDSDYSTFVGAYKPTSIDVPVRDVTGKVIVENGEKVKESRIVYEFVEQAFLQAYTKAWLAYADKADGEKAKEQYLVIEEINRGNCAQIFGDLFQLLDRNGYGFSDYPITADKDMKKQLAKAFKDVSINDAERINNIYGKDIVGKVLSGDILLLPDNLYIWATMNTSDQSLFPIDSAFKRRWDWKYIPISEGKENGVSLGWKIKVNGKLFDWWQFVKKVNDEINEQTKSEDKKLGYFFCKAQDGIVSAETFVSKVVFYLWNDVFKDQDVASIFSDGDEELTFSKFYDTDVSGKTIVKEDKVEVLLQNLGVPVSADTAISEEVVGDIEEEMANDIAGNQRKETLISISIPNHPVIRAADSTQFNAFINALKVIGIDRIIPVVSSLKYKRLGCPVISTQKYEAIENNDKGYKYCQEEGLYIVKGCKHYTYIRILEDLNSSLNIGLTLETR